MSRRNNRYCCRYVCLALTNTACLGRTLSLKYVGRYLLILLLSIFFISEQAIDSASLLVISQEDIKELIPTVGHRALFIAHTNAFKEAISAPVINVPAVSILKFWWHLLKPKAFSLAKYFKIVIYLPYSYRRVRRTLPTYILFLALFQTEDIQTPDTIPIPDFNDISSLDNVTVENFEDRISKVSWLSK